MCACSNAVHTRCRFGDDGPQLRQMCVHQDRSDGKLFNLLRLKASTKTRELCARDLLYADDSALVATYVDEIQYIVY